LAPPPVGGLTQATNAPTPIRHPARTFLAPLTKAPGEPVSAPAVVVVGHAV